MLGSAFDAALADAGMQRLLEEHLLSRPTHLLTRGADVHVAGAGRPPRSGSLTIHVHPPPATTGVASSPLKKQKHKSSEIAMSRHLTRLLYKQRRGEGEI